MASNSQTEIDTSTVYDAPYFYAGDIFAPDVFGEEYNVNAAFIPFAERDFDPLEMLNAVRKTIQVVPGTGRTITRNRVSTLIDDVRSVNTRNFGYAQLLPEEHFLVHEAYPVDGIQPGSDGRGQEFANPRYLDQNDLPSVTTDDDRLTWLDRYAALGTADHEDISPHFGLKKSGIRDLVARHDYPWEEKKMAGRECLARTWKLIRSWGYTAPSIAEPFGVTGNTVRTLIWHKAEDFDPPSDPTA